MKNKPDPALLGLSNLSNDLKKGYLAKSRETIGIVSHEILVSFFISLEGYASVVKNLQSKET
jgi:hypothetical protein